VTPTQGWVLGAAVVVVATWISRGQWEPAWSVWAAVGGAVLHFVLTRRRRLPYSLRPPKIAVVIPVKDNVRTVADVARRSAAHGMPVYVVDDGSTDGSGAACQDVATVLTQIGRASCRERVS
jgi:hypothetical protein